MKCTYDFSVLKIAGGLEELIQELRNKKAPYQEGLKKAIEFTEHNKGTVEHLEGNITQLTVDGFSVACFQPFPEIDLFYFEY